ncbi:MAG: hypothetical protein AAFQ08_03805 [Bacteroidota bacterium]
MSHKTKLTLKAVAIMIAVLAVGMQLKFVIIPALSASKFWLVVGAFVLLLAASQ